jgi:uncharacterized surface protein with fasciclin (FAS1) repeats
MPNQNGSDVPLWRRSGCAEPPDKKTKVAPHREQQASLMRFLREVVVKDGSVTVEGAKVVKTDIVGSNGVIHVIDTALLPEEQGSR